tara:strand:+ start:150 stop:1076 length:927 start_codon:yes stop_codon:yes gene_type:complete
MNVLFVCGGNDVKGISSIIINQANSLEKENLKIAYFPIIGKGFFGYLKNIPILRSHLKKNKYDIIHAHYSMSGFLSSLSGASPTIVSLMGSDVKSDFFFKFFIKIFYYFFWKRIIVKSADMKYSLGINDALIVPNGVDLKRFKPIEKIDALKYLGWDPAKKHILFGADPKKFVKNFKLAREAFNLLTIKNIELHNLSNIPNEIMPYYLNSSDVLLLTSLWEGSPNIIKEAMACNTPIVSTDVGDVKQIISKTNGCFITTFSANDVSDKITKAINYNNKTNGRQNIKHLDSSIVSKMIINEYEKLLYEN